MGFCKIGGFSKMDQLLGDHAWSSYKMGETWINQHHPPELWDYLRLIIPGILHHLLLISHIFSTACLPSGKLTVRHGTWPFRSFSSKNPMKNGDFPSFFVCLPEGNLFALEMLGTMNPETPTDCCWPVSWNVTMARSPISSWFSQLETVISGNFPTFPSSKPPCLGWFSHISGTFFPSS